MQFTLAGDGKHKRGRRAYLNARYRNYDRSELEAPYRSRRKAPDTGYGVVFEAYTPERTYLMTPVPAPPKTTMIVSPIAALLRSRKALTAIIGTLLNLIIAFVPPEVAPRIEAIRGDLITMVTILAGLVIGGISFEDAAEKRAQQVPPISAGSGDVNVNTAPAAPTGTSTPENAPAAPPPVERSTHR